MFLQKQFLDQQAVPPTILNSGAKSPLTKAFVQLAPFLDQTNTLTIFLVLNKSFFICRTTHSRKEFKEKFSMFPHCCEFHPVFKGRKTFNCFSSFVRNNEEQSFSFLKTLLKLWFLSKYIIRIYTNGAHYGYITLSTHPSQQVECSLFLICWHPMAFF